MDTDKLDRHAMVIRADARAMGAVTALNTTHRRKPRLNRALSDCICTMPDGSQRIIARRDSATPRKTKTHFISPAPVSRITAADLPNAAGNIAYD